MFKLGAYSVETTVVRQRLKVITSLIGAAFVCLIIKLGYMQIAQSDYYRSEAEKTQVRQVRVVPSRGVMYDRNGEVLADTRSAFDICIPMLSEAQILKPQGWVATLFKTLDIKPDQLLQQIANQRKFSGVSDQNRILLKEDVSEELVAYLAERMPQVIIVPTSKRQYSRLAVHALGYVDRINENDLKWMNRESYSQNDRIGRAGLEQNYESYLRGTVGIKAIEVNVHEKAVREVTEISKRSQPKAGAPIFTAIDIELQKMAEGLMEGKAGAIVALDPRTGEVLTFLSKPDYDPNGFTYGLTPALWKQLINDPFHVLQNRPIQGLYPPGSVFKIVVATAALEEGAITTQTTFTCRGRFNLGRRTWKCWKEHGHGTVNVYQALEMSCDVFFYNVGILTGVSRLHKYALKYGLGEKSGVDIKGEKAGLIPDATSRPEPNRLWSNGDTANTAIGQGLVIVTPLQIANMFAAVANGKVIYKPHLVKKIKLAPNQFLEKEPDVFKKLDISQSTLNIVRSGLWQVVNGSRGTARAHRLEGVELAGKTGTAQNPHGEDHAWFAAYGPFANPELVIAVLVENGGHGASTAAPLAAQLFQNYFERKSQPQKLTAKAANDDSLF